MTKTFTLAGNVYPLGHLRGFRVEVPQRDPLLASANLQVTFSCHVHSERWNPDTHDPARYFVEGGEERAFCPVRYGCSIGLENHIRYHIAGKAYWGKDGNGVKNSFFYCVADNIPYPVYFRLGRADRISGVDGVLHVISAYQNPSLMARHRYQAVKFARLVHQTCPPSAPEK